MMIQRDIVQPYGDQTQIHVLVGGDDGEARPGVLIFPTVMGVSPLEVGFAERLVGLGFAAIVADLFGRRFTPDQRQDAFAAMGRLRADRAGLRERLLAVLDVARGQAEVDASKVAAIGYCFGGQCALDLARAGADVAGIASFHGLFDPPGLEPNAISAKVVAFHGWDDPMVTPQAVVALAKELTAAGADWQIHGYGHTGHGFTNPEAHQIGIEGVAYNAAAARRSWASLEGFLAEVLA